MKGRKLRGASTVLGRDYHADLFEMAGAKFNFVLIGGSGVTREEYEQRAETLVTVFDEALERLSSEVRFHFMYVTSPADGTYGDDEAVGAWCQHFEHELLPELPRLALFAAGYSGGAVLAFAGPMRSPACFAAGALGADGLTDDLERPGERPIRLLYNLDDRVYGANRDVIRRLVEDEVAECFCRLPGRHALSDYLANESFGGLVRWAARALG